MQVSGMAALASLQQMQQMRQNMFGKADTDGDGGLSIDEFSAAGKNKSSGSANSADQARTEKMFAVADSGNDGKLTENELDSFLRSSTRARSRNSCSFSKARPIMRRIFSARRMRTAMAACRWMSSRRRGRRNSSPGSMGMVTAS